MDLLELYHLFHSASFRQLPRLSTSLLLSLAGVLLSSVQLDFFPASMIFNKDPAS